LYNSSQTMMNIHDLSIVLVLWFFLMKVVFFQKECGNIMYVAYSWNFEFASSLWHVLKFLGLIWAGWKFIYSFEDTDLFFFIFEVLFLFQHFLSKLKLLNADFLCMLCRWWVKILINAILIGSIYVMN
jgi:hypothetical protein